MHVSGTIIQALGTATQNLPTWGCYSLYGCMHDVNLVHTILLFKFSTTLRPLTAMPGCPMYPACWRLSLRRSSMQMLATTRLHLMQSSLWLPLMTPFQVFDGVKVKLGFILFYIGPLYFVLTQCHLNMLTYHGSVESSVVGLPVPSKQALHHQQVAGPLSLQRVAVTQQRNPQTSF